MDMTRQVGGSFAPPLTPEKIEEFKNLLSISNAPPSTKGAITDLLKMAEMFFETPESTEPVEPHPAGVGHVQMLEADEIQRIWDVVPWDYEIEAMCHLFEKLDTSDPLRNVAYHLVWYANELTDDRQPVTTDKIKGVGTTAAPVTTTAAPDAA
jgi:hypothetical protein